MRRYSLILIFCLTTLFSCQRAEVVSESFIDDALDGVLIYVEMDDDIDGGRPPGKYATNCPLVFYSDGTCHQCYTQFTQEGSKDLYHTLQWQIDAENKTLTLTDRKLLASSPDSAVGVLKIKRYKNRLYKLVGTLPVSNSRFYQEQEIHGRIGTAKERAECEERYVSEDEFEE